jgi:hypothetical protein
MDDDAKFRRWLVSVIFEAVEANPRTRRDVAIFFHRLQYLFLGQLSAQLVTVAMSGFKAL